MQEKGAFAEAEGYMPVSFGWAVTEYVPDCHKMWSAIGFSEKDKHMRTAFSACAFSLQLKVKQKNEKEAFL